MKEFRTDVNMRCLTQAGRRHNRRTWPTPDSFFLIIFLTSVTSVDVSQVGTLQLDDVRRLVST